MILDLQMVHILEARCYETEATMIQLLLYYNAQKKVYAFANLRAGEPVEVSESNSYNIQEANLDRWIQFYEKEGIFPSVGKGELIRWNKLDFLSNPQNA